MNLLEVVEELVVNPKNDLSLLDIVGGELAVNYKKSNFHNVRNEISKESLFTDMSHISPAFNVSV